MADHHDSLWLQEVINSLYEAGMQNDRLPLLFLENNNAQVAIKSNERISKRISFRNLIKLFKQVPKIELNHKYFYKSRKTQIIRN